MNLFGGVNGAVAFSDFDNPRRKSFDDVCVGVRDSWSIVSSKEATACCCFFERFDCKVRIAASTLHKQIKHQSSFATSHVESPASSGMHVLVCVFQISCSAPCVLFIESDINYVVLLSTGFRKR